MLELSAENMQSIFVPEGVAHGFITLVDRTSLLYHHTAFHHPESARGLCYDDPMVDLKLPVPVTVMSGRDRSYEKLPRGFVGI
jgi:dTDP-4-dehydrorhamnose 3,5-epimerase